jgi:uncharacterized protein (DUF1015 family)
MVQIKGFKAYKYNKQKVNVQDLITPPYDVIDDGMKKDLRAKSQYNFVNIILNESHDKADELMGKWMDEQILVQDKQDSLYIYQHEFRLGSKTFKRTGFVCLLKTEELGNDILPHEQTFEKHIADRYELRKKTNSDLELIFLIYQDKNREIDKMISPLAEKEADLKFVDDDGCIHRIYKLDDAGIIKKITRSMEDKKLLIADGHHRYQTALRYSKSHGYGYVMAALVNSENEGMVILPTNRVLEEKINVNSLGDYFNITEADKISFKNKSFIVATSEDRYLIGLKQKTELKLDVEILHKIIFGNILNIPLEEQKPPKINFYKGNKATLEAINENNTAFFVNPPSLENAFEIARNHKLMPQKSTYFYPKMFSGFLINKFEEAG